MSETRKYFNLEIGNAIRFYVGDAKYEYPFTFTVEECVEEYCATHGLDLVRILKYSNPSGRLRGGEFWYDQQGYFCDGVFIAARSVQQVVTRMGWLPGIE